jgi:hypothetical protein
MTNEISAIAAYQGAFAPNIIESIYNEMDILSDLFVLSNLTAKRNLWSYRAKDGVRPLDLSIKRAPEGESYGKFGLRTIEPYTAMKYVEVIPAEFMDTFFAETLDENAKELPFAPAFWKEQAKKTGQEINDNFFYNRKPEDVLAYNAGTAYAVGNYMKFTDKNYYKCITITTAGQTPVTHPAKWEKANNECCFDGLGTIIKAERTAGSLADNVTATGAITSTNALTKIDNDMWKNIPQSVKKRGVKFWVSWDVYEKRQDALRDLYKTSGSVVPDNDGDMSSTIIGSSKRGIVKPATWMGDSQMVVATIDRNLVLGTNRSSAINSFGERIPHFHGYDTIMKFIMTSQVAELEFLYINDQD